MMAAWISTARGHRKRTCVPGGMWLEMATSQGVINWPPAEMNPPRHQISVAGCHDIYRSSGVGWNAVIVWTPAATTGKLAADPPAGSAVWGCNPLPAAPLAPDPPG